MYARTLHSKGDDGSNKKANEFNAKSTITVNDEEINEVVRGSSKTVQLLATNSTE